MNDDITIDINAILEGRGSQAISKFSADIANYFEARVEQIAQEAYKELQSLAVRKIKDVKDLRTYLSSVKFSKLQQCHYSISITGDGYILEVGSEESNKSAQINTHPQRNFIPTSPEQFKPQSEITASHHPDLSSELLNTRGGSVRASEINYSKQHPQRRLSRQSARRGRRQRTKDIELPTIKSTTERFITSTESDQLALPVSKPSFLPSTETGYNLFPEIYSFILLKVDKLLI